MEENKEAGEASKEATPAGEEAKVEYFDLATPEKEEGDRLARQLFSASARPAATAQSVTLQGHVSEGECKSWPASTLFSIAPAGPWASGAEGAVDAHTRPARVKCQADKRVFPAGAWRSQNLSL